MNKKSPSTSIQLSPPESFFVFVVGHCEEWPEYRDEQGDAAIYKEYLDFGVPADQCIYLKDSECTRENCQQVLRSFLERSHPSSSETQNHQQPCPEDTVVKPPEKNRIPHTLIFYYGGHGSANGFATIGGTWSYKQVTQTVEEFFHGDRVLYLLDCCAAGNLCQYLPLYSSTSKCTTQKQYALLATSQPYILTSAEGEEWILTNTWNLLMRHFRDTDQDSNDYMKLEQMISVLADRHVFELGDQFFAYVTSTTLSQQNTCEIDNSWSWVPAPEQCCRQQQIDEGAASSGTSSIAWLSRSDSSSEELYKMPREAKNLSFHDFHVGDAIAYKHLGGCPLSLASSVSTPSSSIAKHVKRCPFYVPPLWLNGTIVSIFGNGGDKGNDEIKNRGRSCDDILLRIRVWYPSQIESWEVEISHRSPQLINHFFVAQKWMLPRSFLETQVVLAQKYQQYLDCSVPVYTPVQVVLRQSNDDNGEDILAGTILDWKDFKWKRLLQTCTGVIPATTGYDEYYWNELPIPVKTAAVSLGYTKSSWDNDTGIPADKMDWEELTKVQKDAATVLGYVQQKSASPSADSNLYNRQESFWKNTAEISTCAGPHVPIEWNRNHQLSFVPLNQVQFPNEATSNVNTSSKPSLSLTAEVSDNHHGVEELQRQSLIKGLQSSGKSIGDAESIFGTKELSAFWPDNEQWYDAEPIEMACQERSNLCDKDSLLDVLVTHFEYTLPGIYCPIKYEDGVRHLIPLSYIFRRGCQPSNEQEHVNEDKSDPEDLASNSLKVSTADHDVANEQVKDSNNRSDHEDLTSTSSKPTQDDIDKITKSLREISSKVSSFGKPFSEIVCKLEEASSLISESIEIDGGALTKEVECEGTACNEKSLATSATSGSATEAASDPSPTKSYIDEYWRNLPTHIKAAAQRIGYSKKIWDTDGSVPIELKEWKDLTTSEKMDLEAIGYKESNWCNEDDSADYSDSSDY